MLSRGSVGGFDVSDGGHAVGGGRSGGLLVLAGRGCR